MKGDVPSVCLNLTSLPVRTHHQHQEPATDDYGRQLKHQRKNSGVSVSRFFTSRKSRNGSGPKE